MPSPLSEDELAHVRAAILAGRKIEAVKHYREATGAGLKEAKDFVDQLEAELRAESPEKFAAPPGRWGCTLAAGGLFFVLFGLMWIAMGIHESWPRWKRLAGTERGTGVVAEVLRGAGDEADLVVVDFQAAGQAIRLRHPTALSPAPYSLGEHVEVRYPPGKPEQAVVATFWETWVLLLGLGGFGVLFAAIGISVLWFVKRQPEKGG